MGAWNNFSGLISAKFLLLVDIEYIVIFKRLEEIFVEKYRIHKRYYISTGISVDLFSIAVTFIGWFNRFLPLLAGTVQNIHDMRLMKR